ncbi:hypothetical protein ACOMHN_015050 [Nucella lapillus]
MTYLNHFTKFCILRPLTSKRAEEVAVNLLDIFLLFGAPAILQSDNGREFVNALIAELSTLWPNLKLVTGRPRHPQSQGAVERVNGVVQDKLAIWMRENKTKKWSMGLRFVQWQINISEHETIRQSPFKVTFGEDPKVGLASTVVPRAMFGDVHTEEELDFLCENRGPSPVRGDDDDDDNASQSSSATVIGRPTRRGLSAVRGDDDDDDNASQSSSATIIGRPTRRGLSAVRGDDDDDDNASQSSSASVIGRPTRRGLSPVRYDDDDDDNASQTSSASVIGRPTRRGLSPVRYDDDGDDNASQTSSASVIGHPTRRGLSPVRYDNDDDDNASQTSSASVIGRPTRRGLLPVRGDGDDDDNASQSSSASVIGRPIRRGLSPVRYDDDDASQSSSDDRARVQRFREVRKVAFRGQQKTAERMVEKSKRLLVNLDVGQCATIRVPDVDRGPSYPKNMLVVVLAADNGMFTLGCKEGVLRSKVTAADLHPVKEPLLSASQVPNITIGVRQATAKALLNRHDSLAKIILQGTFKEGAEEVDNLAKLSGAERVAGPTMGGPLDMTLPELLWHWAQYRAQQPALIFRHPNPDPDLNDARYVLTYETEDNSDLVALAKQAYARLIVMDSDLHREQWTIVRGLCQLHDPVQGFVTSIRLPDLRAVLQIKRVSPPNEEDFICYLRQVCSKEYSVTPAPFAQHPCVVLKTAGGGGRSPKLVVHTHRNIVAFSKIFMPRTDSPRPMYFLNHPFGTVRGHMAVSLCNPVTRILLDERPGEPSSLPATIYKALTEELCPIAVLPPSVTHDVAAQFQGDPENAFKLTFVGLIGEEVLLLLL